VEQARRRDARAGREDRAAAGGRPRRDGAAARADADEVFGFLDRVQADRLRELVVEAFAAGGVRVTVDGGSARSADGRVFGLAALAGECVDVLGRRGRAGDPLDGASERGWSELVRAHVGRMLVVTAQGPAGADGDPGWLPPQAALRGAHLRVVGLATLPDEAAGWFGYGRHLAGDLLEVIAHAGAGGVRLLRDEDVAAHPPGVLRAAGLENLLRVPRPEHRLVSGRYGEQLHVLTGESPFTASTLLVLPEVLHRVTGTAAYPDGVLVAVPYRHQLAFSPVEGGSLLAALEALVPFAAKGFADGVGAVSPFVFWWHDGALTQVSVLTETGGWAVDDTGAFGALLDRLLPG